MSLNAKFNRKNPTKAENRLWYYLRNRRLNGYKFIRQVVIGPYIADFVCREKKVVLEVDGGQHGEDLAKAYDERRTAFIESCGYQVIRVWNCEVMKDINTVLEWILFILKNKEDVSPPSLRVRDGRWIRK